MSHVVVSNLAYAHPGGDVLFSEVSFKLGPGQHAGLVGANGVGKTTLFRVLAGQVPAADGDVHIGPFAYMPQDVGIRGGGTVRELLLEAAPARLRDAGERMLAAERELAGGGEPAVAGMRLGVAIGDWSTLGGYELEACWDAACGGSCGRDSTRSVLEPRRSSPVASASASCSRCCSKVTPRCSSSMSQTTSSTSRRRSSLRRGSLPRRRRSL